MELQAKSREMDYSIEEGERAHVCESLRECLRGRLAGYFAQLGDEAGGDLYRLVVAEVETPLLEMTLDHTRGNLSRAAEVLGINRATLRRKLRQYGIAGC